MNAQEKSVHDAAAAHVAKHIRVIRIATGFDAGIRSSLDPWNYT